MGYISCTFFYHVVAIIQGNRFEVPQNHLFKTWHRHHNHHTLEFKARKWPPTKNYKYTSYDVDATVRLPNKESHA